MAKKTSMFSSGFSVLNAGIEDNIQQTEKKSIEEKEPVANIRESQTEKSGERVDLSEVERLRKPIFSLNKPECVRVYNRKSKSKPRKITLYLREDEYELIHEIAESYNMKVSKFLQNIIYNMAKGNE